MNRSILTLFSILIIACTNVDKKTNENSAASEETFKQLSPSFNADSAYAYVKKQVDFGPRVPGTKAHAQCAAFFVEKLKSFKLEVIQQAGSVSTYDGKTFQLKNIIASYKPEAANRILLLSHWDSRPIADEDISNQNTAIDGADDGGSSSAVLLELARQISASKLNIGVDFLF
jgi:Zn-dependent M28 family amino/carboxypeptidase